MTGQEGRVADSLAKVFEGYRPGFALPGAAYKDPEAYELEVRHIVLKAWHYVGHHSQVPERGDWFLFEIAGESVIVVRGGDGAVNAFMNVCRHRGSRICDVASGHDTRFTCRYHGWTYGLDGSLKAAARMAPGTDKGALGLRRLHARVLEGLIFVNFDDDPPDFAVLEAGMGPALRPYGLDRARVAHRRNYPIASNWKLAVENYCECYHCQPAHPEYSVGHGRALPNEECDAMLSEVMAKASAVGLRGDVIRRSWLNAPAFGLEHGFDRYPLLRGQLTGSRDGCPVAPLLGSITGYDGGTTDLHLGPLTFALAYCDHVVVYRFAPRGQLLTDCEITWLVNGQAVEGKDYSLADLTWLWDVTTIADKEIIERNQAGVNSRYYVPGPLSEVMETFTQEFLDWYVAVMRRVTGGGLPGRRPVASIPKAAERGRT
jgi:phenylpropionate dioxygenase-like ring-hydroxylating dioxygenase large terminal subunit